MSPSTAQNTAALLALRSRIALPPLRSEGAQSCVRCAEGWRVLGVDEIHLAGRFDSLSFGDEAVAVVASDYFGGAVEALFEAVADLAEGGHPSPAGFQGARAGEAVTFAVGAHVVFDSLRTKRNNAVLRIKSINCCVNKSRFNRSIGKQVFTSLGSNL